MVLIIGGAYQGKLDFAIAAFALGEGDIFTCQGTKIDFSKACVNALEEFTWACAQEGTDPVAFFRANREKWKNSVLICQDLFCGVVPMEPRERQWRQDTGRLCQYLAWEAERVSRIFCGLEQRLK